MQEAHKSLSLCHHLPPRFVPLQAVHPGDLTGSGATCPSGLSTSAGGLAWLSGADEDQRGASSIPGPATSIQRI